LRRREQPTTPAPAVLDAEQRREWQALWSSPVAQAAWIESDAALVVRLLQLRRRCEQEGARWQVEAVRQLEDRLLLNDPRGRKAAGLPAVEPEPPTETSPRNGRRKMTSRERERLLRG